MAERKWDLVWKGTAPMAGVAEEIFSSNGIDVMHRDKGSEEVELFVPDEDRETAAQLLRDWTL